MICTSLKIAAKDMPAGFELTGQYLDAAIDANNSKRGGAARIGREKREAVYALILSTAEAVYIGWTDNYHEYTYEKGYANANCYSHPAWNSTAKDPSAKGSWAQVYTNTPAAAKAVQSAELTRFKERFPLRAMSDVPLSAIKLWRREWQFLTTLSLRERLWQNWVVHQISAGTSFTSAAVDEAAGRYREGHFDDELDNLVAVRGNAATFGTSTLDALPGGLRCRQGLAARVGDAEARQTAARSHLEGLAAIEAQIQKDAEAFQTAVEQHQAAAGDSVRRSIALKTRKAQLGAAAIKECMPTTFRVHDHASPKTSKLSLDELVEGIAAAALGASAAAKLTLPIVHVWDLNTGGTQIDKTSVWKPIADAIATAMQSYKSQSILALVCKRSGARRHDFHYELHKYFEAAGVSTNDTFSMHLDFSHGGVKQSRDAPGRIGFIIPIAPEMRPGEDNIFGDSRLVQGVIPNVAVPQVDGDADDSTRGSASQALRLTRVPEDSWTQIVRAALQAAKPAEPKSPLIVNQLKNKRGLPLAVAVFWDPSPYSAVDAALRWKKDEAAWRMDEPEQADLRCMFVPFDPEREVEVATYIEQAGSRAWSRGELIVDNFEVEAEEPSSAAGGQTPEVPEPVLEVTRVLPDGSLDVKMALFQKYLEVDATQHKAEHILRQFVKTFTGDASPRLPPRQAPQGPSSAAASQDAVAALQNDRPDVVTRNLEAPGSLAELERLHGPWTVDVTLPNAKLRVLINGRGHGFGVAVGAIKVQQDAIFILPGAGGFLKDEEQKVEHMFAAQCEISSDNCEVLFFTSTREKPRARMYTLYGFIWGCPLGCNVYIYV